MKPISIGVFGTPQAGKTHTAKLLSQVLDIPYYDLDNMIAHVMNQTPHKEFLEMYGFPLPYSDRPTYGQKHSGPKEFYDLFDAHVSILALQALHAVSELPNPKIVCFAYLHLLPDLCKFDYRLEVLSSYKPPKHKLPVLPVNPTHQVFNNQKDNKYIKSFLEEILNGNKLP